jgi:hypothetical protein
MSRKLMFVVNVDWFFMPHRLPIALQAWAEEYELHVDETSFRTQSSICPMAVFDVPSLAKEMRLNLDIAADFKRIGNIRAYTYFNCIPST